MKNIKQFQSPFRPLSVELKLPNAVIQAGTHDMDKISISSESVTDLLVFQHEMHHEQALKETNYGIIQSIFRIVYDTPKSRYIRDSVADWLLLLYNQSRHAHEALATYLSIKEQPFNKCASLVNELPPEYKKYYNMLAVLIDDILPNTFLQYMVGKIVIEICFSSRLIDTMLNWKPETTLHLKDEDSPDKRFDLLFPIWSKRLPEMRDLLVEKCPEQDFFPAIGTTFDILSEQDWNALQIQAAEQIDNWLEIECRAWMYPIASEVIPCSVKSEWFNQRRRFIEHMNTFSNRQLYLTGNEQAFYNESYEKKRARKAKSAGRAVISNPIPDLLQLERINKSSMFELIGFSTPEERGNSAASISTKYSSMIFISDQPGKSIDDNRDWGMFQFIGKKCLRGYLIEHKDFINLCNTQTAIAALGAPIQEMRIIVGLWATETTVDISLMQELLRAYSLGSMRLALDNVIWYMGGDFITFFDFLAAKGGLEGFFNNPNDPDPYLENLSREELIERCKSTTHIIEDGTKFSSRFAKHPIWFFFRSPIIEGLFFKILPYGNDAFLYVGEEFISGRVRMLDKHEMETSWESVSGIEIPIFTMWSSF